MEGYTLLQPGEKLDITALIKAKKYKKKGNKTALVDTCATLEGKGLGKLHKLGSARGTPMVSYYWYYTFTCNILVARPHQEYILYYYVLLVKCSALCIGV